MKITTLLIMLLITAFPLIANAQQTISDEEYYLHKFTLGVKHLQSSDRKESDRATDDLMGVSLYIGNASEIDLKPLITKLTKIIKDEKSYVRRNCLLVMRQIKHRKVVEMVISSLKDKNESVRYTAAESLPLTRTPNTTKPPLRAVDLLIQLSKRDKSAIVRAGAGVALGSYHLHYPKNEKIYAALKEAAKDPDARVREEVNYMLVLAKERESKF
ncbi:MAG: HEAT repeat domain-containing protein [Alphaproteobacteria bacterium]